MRFRKSIFSFRTIFIYIVIVTTVYRTIHYENSAQTEYSHEKSWHESSTQNESVSTRSQQLHRICIPDPKCVQKPYPVLNRLRKGTLKPSPMARTIYFKTIGRLGNILYEFAALLAFAKATCTTVKVSSPRHLHDIFEEVPFQVLSDADLTRESSGASYFDTTSNPDAFENITQTALYKDVFIKGVFPRFGWFAGCADYVKKKLRLKEQYIEKGKEVLNNMIQRSRKHNVTTVALHVRRSDKTSLKFFERGFRVPNMTFFDKAISYFDKKYKNVIYIMTTDDRKWVSENFLRKRYPNVYLAPKNVFQIDFALLTLCDHTIFSGGTFGEWVAFISGGETVYFRDDRVCPFALKCNPINYKPPKEPIWPGWIPMTN